MKTQRQKFDGDDACYSTSSLSAELGFSVVASGLQSKYLKKTPFLRFHLLSSSVTYLYIRELSSYSFLTPAHLKSIDDEMNCCSNTFFELPITFPFTQPFHLPLFSLFNLIQFVFSFLLLLWFLYRCLSFFVTAAQVTAIIADKPESSLFCHLHCAPNNIAANCNDG